MKNVIFCGVGGQGVILASKVLMEVAVKAGYDVRESEIHGMAQRGGSVECNVRFGKKVYSPLIEKGNADFVVSFELLESLRKLEYLKTDGVLISNNLKIEPSTVANGAAVYPADIEAWLSSNVKNARIIDTAPVLKEIGNAKALNILMLGVLSQSLDFSLEEWHCAIRSLVKESFVDMNIAAFNKGRELK
jgi:indolepyruvate ferredoxin oxidoreductase, beta subunit